MSSADTTTALRVQYRDPDTGLKVDVKTAQGYVRVFADSDEVNSWLIEQRTAGDKTAYSLVPAFGQLSAG